jgi:hypothetical protein
MKQENELKDELRAQPALDHQKPKTGTPHSIAHSRRRLDRIIPLSPTPNCRVLLPSGTADDEVFADDGGVEWMFQPAAGKKSATTAAEWYMRLFRKVA